MSNIIIENLSFTYSRKTPFEKKALIDINLVINEGEFVGIIGHTGSGKSTFIQHLNGLIMPQEGTVKIFDVDLSVKKPKPDLRKLRGDVGMVFQYPEYQLFDETVARDVAFGPKNLKLPKEEIDIRVKEAIEMVGLDYYDIKDRAPFDLSGGQKRRVAIAGVIAMRPKALILDEPTAGLDPRGKEQILSLITHLKEHCTPTIIVISHDVDEITRFADRIIVFNEAKIEYDMPMKELFTNEKSLQEIGLDIPKAIKINNELKKRGVNLEGDIITPLDLEKAVVRYYNKYKGGNLDIGALPEREIMPQTSAYGSLFEEVDL